MASRLNWDRTTKGYQSADDLLDLEWRTGPKHVGGRDDTTPSASPYSLDWNMTLWHRFGRELTDDAMTMLFRAAAQDAVTECKRLAPLSYVGWMKKLYERASGKNPFPSAYYALFFHFCAHVLVSRRRFLRCDEPTMKRVQKFLSNSEIYVRTARHGCDVAKRFGGRDAMRLELGRLAIIEVDACIARLALQQSWETQPLDPA